MTQPAGSILVVDDESTVRNLIAKVLNSAGYRTLQAEDGLVAYQLIQQFHDSFSLIISDVQMPRMKGTELAERLKAEYPELEVLFISGYAEPVLPGCRFLPKPFTAKALCAAVKDILEAGKTAKAGGTADSLADLRRRLDAARAKLEATRMEYDRLAAQFVDAVDSPWDGHLALRQAITLRQAALDEYGKALREWTEFISGATPPGRS
jgi:CheY-like chemotaxis protein